MPNSKSKKGKRHQQARSSTTSNVRKPDQEDANRKMLPPLPDQRDVMTGSSSTRVTETVEHQDKPNGDEWDIVGGEGDNHLSANTEFRMEVDQSGNDDTAKKANQSPSSVADGLFQMMIDKDEKINQLMGEEYDLQKKLERTHKEADYLLAKLKRRDETIEALELKIGELESLADRNTGKERNDPARQSAATAEDLRRISADNDLLRKQVLELDGGIRLLTARVDRRDTTIAELDTTIAQLDETIARYKHRDEEQHKYLSEHGINDLSQVVKEWKKTRDNSQKLKSAEERLSKLQEEMLSSVDRHEPEFDEKIQRAFAKLNKRIGNFVKDRTIIQFAQADPLNVWDQDVLFEGSVIERVSSITDKKSIKFLLRQAVWKFLDVKLFDRRQPLACFGSRLSQQLHPTYPHLFPDYEINESAAKWRALMVRQLLAIEGDEENKAILEELVAEFASLVAERMHFGSADAQDLVAKLKEGDMGIKLKDVLTNALELARLVVGERAGYSLKMPNVKRRTLKVEEDELMTTMGGVGVDPAMETEVIGVVRFCVSPALIKWGSGSGQNLNESTVLMKAFVEVE